MNIMAINFDWILTIPGMLITSGVLLLVIALIIFVVTTVKAKKEEAKGQDVALENAQETPIPDVAPIAPVPTVANIQAEDKVVASTTVSIFPSVRDTPLAAEKEESPVNVIPVTPVEETKEAVPVTMDEKVDVIPQVTDTPVTNEPTQIYGGADLSVPPIVEEPHQIYGGADPMEKTIKMDPIIEPTPVVPEVNPIVEEATLTDVAVDTVKDNNDTAVVDNTTTDYTVETSIPEVQPINEEVQPVEAIPVETEEKIEQL